MEQGVIIFSKINIGSKSERYQPFLYQGEGKFLRLRKEGDNPFVNENLKPFDGKTVKITGTQEGNDVFCVQSIEEF